MIGLALLGERLQGGVGGILLAVAGAAVAAYGVVVLTRSPRTLPVTGETAPDFLPSIPGQPVEPAALHLSRP